MEKEKLKNILEAILMTAESPISVSDLLKLFEAPFLPERDDIKEALNSLQEDYAGRGIELIEVANGFRIQVCEDYAEWVNRLYDEKPARYSRALLETLAIIAYRQPITRGEIEEIRGVAVSSNIVKTLQERGWIRIVGHRDVPGKPALIATTKEFLDYFNLKKLSELPSLAEIKDFDQMNPDLFEGLEVKNKEGEGAEEQELSPELAKEMEQDADEVVAESVEESDGAEATEEENLEEGSSEKGQLEEDVEQENDNVIPFTG